MLRRRQRTRSRGSVLWTPLVWVGVLIVAAGAASRIYEQHRIGINTYTVTVVGLAAIALFTIQRFKRWWRS